MCYTEHMKKKPDGLAKHIEVVRQMLDRKGTYYRKYKKNVAEYRRQMKEKRGPHYEHWKAGYARFAQLTANLPLRTKRTTLKRL